MSPTIRFLSIFTILLLLLGSTGAIPSYAYLVTNEPASLVIGQSDFTTATCAITRNGLCFPSDTLFDKSGNLWVADSSNNRVIEFKAPFSNGELASIVIGQSSFTTNACATTQSSLCHPSGLAFDGSGNLWVTEFFNNRVTEFKPPFSNGESAALVIGQSSFTTKTCAVTQNGLCGPGRLAFDKSGNAWVSDDNNNRVLKFSSPFSNGESASIVIGQSSFTSNACATTQNGLCNPVKIAFDSSGNMWIDDLLNSRLLKFDAPLTTGESASMEIGQSGFTTGTCAISQNGLCDPQGIAFDSSSNMWVADESNNNGGRVLEFKAPFSNGESASLVIGQSGFTTNSCATTQSGLCAPQGVTLDQSGNLWVADYNNDRVLRFSRFVSGEVASTVLGQSSFITNACATSSNSECLPIAATFDKSGNLWVSDSSNNRILEYKSPLVDGESASVVLGQSTFTTSACSTTQTGLCNPFGIAFDKVGNLWVADRQNNRTLQYKPPFSDGESASIVIGQSSFTSGACATTQGGLCFPIGLSFDKAGSLWIADNFNARLLKFAAPFSDGELASLVIGQIGFTTKACAATLTGLCHPWGMAFDSSGNLWVADAGNNRVLEFKTTLHSGESASLVIGQSSFTSNTCATTQSGLCRPDDVIFDKVGNLWVADTFNSRILGFGAPFASGESASIVIGQTGFTTGSCTQSPASQGGLCIPTGIAFDFKGNLWVVDDSNSRVIEFT